LLAYDPTHAGCTLCTVSAHLTHLSPLILYFSLNPLKFLFSHHIVVLYLLFSFFIPAWFKRLGCELMSSRIKSCITVFIFTNSLLGWIAVQIQLKVLQTRNLLKLVLTLWKLIRFSAEKWSSWRTIFFKRCWPWSVFNFFTRHAATKLSHFSLIWAIFIWRYISLRARQAFLQPKTPIRWFFGRL
jgi:hypothetical protein